MKILRVGDPHAKVGNLEEMRKLFTFISNVATQHKVGRIEILGDLFHSHAVLRLEVQEFWTWALNLLSDTHHTVVLVGNHDQSGDYKSSFSALSVFNLLNKKNLYIIEKPQTLDGVFAYAPYTHDHKSFTDSALALHKLGARVLVCHQTIQGSRYESGFYASDGIETGEWSNVFTHVISGHIHAEQNFGNIIYPGTARWDTTSDANQRKGIWIFDHDGEGQIVNSEFISTEHVCTPILELTYLEGQEEPKIPENSKTSIVLVGTSDWVKKEREKFKGKASIKVKFTDAKKTVIRKAGNTLEEFLKIHHDGRVERLIELAKEMGIV